MIDTSIKKLLHPRIIESCEKIFNDTHYDSAARKSMIEVEVALKERGEFDNTYFGKRLIKKTFGNGNKFRLKIPLMGGEQKKAQAYFEGVYEYYRNYLMHNIHDINEVICLRILVLASDLLDLIGTSQVSLAGMGGVKGVIAKYGFEKRERLSELLELLSTQKFPNETFDGMFEELANKGFSDEQYEIVFELDLVEYKSKIMNHSMSDDDPDWDDFGWLELTDLGRKVLKELKT